MSQAKGQVLRLEKGYELYYRDEGQGLPVLFLHGSGQGASGQSNFGANAAYFREKGFRTLLPDLLGFGQSSKPEDEAYTADFHLSAIKQWIDHLSIKSLVLVGNSLGGALALHFALRYPEYVAKLVLMAPGGIEAEDVYRKMPGIQAVYKAAYTPGELSREHLQKILSLQVVNQSLITAEIIEERYAVAKTQPKGVWTSMKVPFIGDRLHEIRQPILCFWGKEDQFLPVSGATMMVERCAQIRSVVLGACGHWVMKEYPHIFNPYAVGFINE